MLQPVRRDATYEDLLRVPENLVAELIDGELFVTPRPASPHAHVLSCLAGFLNVAYHQGLLGPGGWWIISEPELHFGRNVLVPDMAGWRRERMPVMPKVAAFELAPDWVCEVVSPNTGRLDRVRKLPKYAEQEINHAWLVQPIERTLTVYRLEGPGWRLTASYGGDDVVRPEPFDAVDLELARIWLPEEAEPTPPSPR